MKRITCLILDMGGVLTQDQREDKVTEMMGILGAGERASFLEAYWRRRLDYDRGVSDGAAYWLGVAGDLGLRLSDPAIASLIRADLASWFNMRAPMFAFLDGARGRIGRLVLLSNIHPDGARFIRDGEGRPWSSRFDDLVLSCEHGLLKPEIAIYELALKAAGVPPGEALFVDDSPANVEGARRAGMSSFRFAGEEDFAATIEREYELTR
jgi:putative hydrolase of the HAD superfamily